MSKELIEIAPTTLESYTENLGQKLQMATVLLKSGLLPASYRSAESVLTAVLYGKELGFSPMRSLNCINVINNKPTLSAQGLKAIAIKNGGRFETIIWNETTCKLKVVRDDWEQEFEFTIKDAERMQLTGKDNWKKNA